MSTVTNMEMQTLLQTDYITYGWRINHQLQSCKEYIYNYFIVFNAY